jgi:fumarate reductase subunit C
MNSRPTYTEFRPRWHRTRMSTYWWLKHRDYLVFILRELSSVFVAWFVVYLLMLIVAVSQGEASYQQFLSWTWRRAVFVLNLVSLLFVLFHSITWFNLAPQAMAVHFRGKRVQGVWIAAANYLAWALVSALVAWILLPSAGTGD